MRSVSCRWLCAPITHFPIGSCPGQSRAAIVESSTATRGVIHVVGLVQQPALEQANAQRPEIAGRDGAPVRAEEFVARRLVPVGEELRVRVRPAEWRDARRATPATPGAAAIACSTRR